MQCDGEGHWFDSGVPEHAVPLHDRPHAFNRSSATPEYPSDEEAPALQHRYFLHHTQSTPAYPSDDDDEEMITYTAEDPVDPSTSPQRSSSPLSDGSVDEARDFSAYASLLANQAFRSLYLSSFVSWIGDSFVLVTLIALVQRLWIGPSGSEAIGLSIFWSLQSLVPLFVSPFAGVVADRMDKRMVMVAADVTRGVVVAIYLLVLAIEDRHPTAAISILFCLLSIQSALAGFFDPASGAYLPQIVPPNRLLLANSLSNITWAITSTLGLGAGGLVAAALGFAVNIICDSISFFLSALFIAQTFPAVAKLCPWISCTRSHTPRPTSLIEEDALALEVKPIDEQGPSGPEDRPSAAIRPTSVFREFVEGVHYMWHIHRDSMWLTLIKGFVNIGLGASDVLIPRFAGYVFLLGRADGTVSLGIVYGAASLAAFVSNLLLSRYSPTSAYSMRRSMQIGVVAMTAGLFLLSWSPDYLVFVIAACLVTSGNTTLYVFTTTLLQQEVLDRVRGRVFATGVGIRATLHAIGAVICSLLIYLFDSVSFSTKTGLMWASLIFAIINLLFSLAFSCLYLPTWKPSSVSFDLLPDSEVDHSIEARDPDDSSNKELYFI